MLSYSHLNFWKSFSLFEFLQMLYSISNANLTCAFIVKLLITYRWICSKYVGGSQHEEYLIEGATWLQMYLSSHWRQSHTSSHTGYRYFKIEYHAAGDLVATTAVVWQMMYSIKDWFINLLILSTVYEHDKQKTIVF